MARKILIRGYEQSVKDASTDVLSRREPAVIYADGWGSVVGMIWGDGNTEVQNLNIVSVGGNLDQSLLTGLQPGTNTVIVETNTALQALANIQEQINGLKTTLAFPGAVGYGKNAKGGRDANATVYTVSNLNDSGAGSLRAACEASGPRYVIFEISGMIQLASNINIENPFITICGQTAPSPGIFLRDYTINVKTHEVIIRHLTSMPGGVVSTADNRDAFKITSETTAGTDIYNVVFDNCTGKWATDENWGIFQDQGTRIYGVTIQDCLAAEALDDQGAKGVQIGYDAAAAPATADRPQVSLINNIFAHQNQRNPLVKRHCDVEAVNNIIYNYQNSGLDAGSDTEPGDGLKVHLRKNLFKGGSDTTGGGDRPPILLRDVDDSPRIYCDGNVSHFVGGSETEPSNQEDLVIVGLGGGIASNPNAIQTAPVLDAGYTTEVMSLSLMKSVLPNIVGARPLERLADDQTVIDDYLNTTGAHKTWAQIVTQYGGFPTIASVTTDHTLPENPHVDSGNGYHNIEVWLEEKIKDVEPEVKVTINSETDTITGNNFDPTDLQFAEDEIHNDYTQTANEVWAVTSGTPGVVKSVYYTSTGSNTITVPSSFNDFGQDVFSYIEANAGTYEIYLHYVSPTRIEVSCPRAVNQNPILPPIVFSPPVEILTLSEPVPTMTISPGGIIMSPPVEVLTLSEPVPTMSIVGSDYWFRLSTGANEAQSVGDDLVRISGNANFLAGGSTIEALADGADGHFLWQIITTNNQLCGLSTYSGATPAGLSDVDFAMYLIGGGTVRVFESGTNRGDKDTFSDGDWFRVRFAAAENSGRAIYEKSTDYNPGTETGTWTLVYNSAVARPSGQMSGCGRINLASGEINNAKMFGTVEATT